MTDKTDKTDATAAKKADEESNTRRQEIKDDERAGDQARFVEKTPRDVAINKAKMGEDTGLESSRPDKTERFRVPGRFVARGEFEDFDGRTWKVVKVEESKAARIDPEAVRKDGGDPHILGVASAPPVQVADGEIAEKSVIPTRTGNAQPSEDPVQAPLDRARIASEDHPSTRPGSTTARLAQAEADAAPKAKSGAPSKFQKTKAVVRKK